MAQDRLAGMWHRLRPKGVRFSFAGTVMLMFTLTLGWLMIRFPRFHSIKVGFGVMLLLNVLFFLRFRDRPRRSWFDRMMQSRFFPRKLSFTNEGRFLVVITLGMGFAAVNTGSNLLYLLLGMLLSLITASGILSEFSVQKVDWTTDFPELAVAGSETLFPVRVRNRKRRLSSLSLDSEVMLPQEVEVRQVRGTVLKLEPGGTDRLFSRVVFPRRGRFRLVGLSLGTCYPFSFFRKSRQFQIEHAVVVLPRADREVSHLVFALSAGFEEHANRVGRGQEFFAVRPMQAGDDWRDVHWKQYARTGRFSVREYEALTARRIHVRASPSAPPLPPSPGRDAGQRKARDERREEGIELTASLLRRLSEAGFEVGLLAPGIGLHPGAGPSLLKQGLTALALLDLDAGAAIPRPSMLHGRDVIVDVDLDTLEVKVDGRLLAAGVSSAASDTPRTSAAPGPGGSAAPAGGMP
ncbi:MAG: DUF58 domain-containing protein [Deltaproteobacteria bacterium]|nr:DUF58 domain-containing protein [Deltaproteobacteria bacterium]